MGPRAGLDGCAKSLPYREPIPGPFGYWIELSDIFVNTQDKGETFVVEWDALSCQSVENIPPLHPTLQPAQSFLSHRFQIPKD